MDFSRKLLIVPGSKVDLSDIETGYKGKLTKEEAKEQTAKNLARIAELQELLYSDHKQSLLIVLQAMDAGGKDGTVKVIAGAMNPQGVRVASFKAPSLEEREHDFLWRIHKQTPNKGEVVVFNRSHYEDVLIVRVHDMVPEKVWKKRYDRINEFEQNLTDNNTHVLKFFLHISKDEQIERLKERLDTPSKHWKVNEGDFTEREFWDKYQDAYEDALGKCSTDAAPWFAIPADKKWFRDLAISTIVLEKLESLKMEYPPPTGDITAIRKKYFPDDPLPGSEKPAKADEKPAKKKSAKKDFNPK